MSRVKSNIVSILRDRELNNKVAPYFLTSKIVRRLLQSDKDLYSTKWSKKSEDRILYEDEVLFLNDYTEYIPVNCIKRNSIESPAMRNVQNYGMVEIHDDAIIYSGVKGIENTCQCILKCMCFSKYLILITDSKYLDIHLLANGRIVRRVYLGEDTTAFRECHWDSPNERFSLVGYESPIETDMNYIPHLMVFTVPLELHVHLEIKKTVFSDVESVKLFQNLLIVQRQQTTADYIIYNFDEFVKQGTVTPYKLGDGNIGTYPTGVPINFTYLNASPILLKVKGYLKEILIFNENPTLYIAQLGLVGQARIFEVEKNSVTNAPLFKTRACNFEEINTSKIHDIKFHPDKTGNVIFQKKESVDFYKIVSRKDKCRISKQHSFEIVPRIVIEKSPVRVLSFAYNSELNIFGILIHFNYPNNCNLIVNIYDNRSAEYLRSVELKEVKINDVNNYLLYVTSYSLIVCLTELTYLNYVHVYVM